ncbi:MAG: hypothetical protein Tsb002_19340 [Wenzhouxiangellaceae bacterium]
MSPRQWTMDDVLQPYTWAGFRDDYWQQQPLHIHRGQADYFATLAAVDDIDFMLGAYAGQPGFAISVIGSRIDSGVPEQLRSSNPRHWTPERVYQRLAQGATIRIGNVARYLPEVARMAAGFEQRLQTDININLYYTPRQSRAFEAHYDNHDVFIIQVAGSKRWRLFQQAEQWPVEVVYRGRLEWLRQHSDAGFSPPVSTRGEPDEVILRAGDMLYVPRGRVHQVSTLDDSPSLHLTVAAPVVTWYEACVQGLLRAFRHSPELRQALPPDFATHQDNISAEQYAAVAAAVAQHLNPDVLRQAVAEMGRQFIDSRRGDWHHSSSDVESWRQLTLDQPLRLRPALLYRLQREPTQILVRFWGQTITVPLRCETMLQHVLEASPFRARDLTTHLSDQSRLVFCQSLLQQGLIVRVDDERAG